MGNQKFLYTIDELHQKWRLLMSELKKIADSKGKNFFPESYDTSYAVAILSWYGLTIEQMLKIKLCDVDDAGIKKVDVCFDKESKDFFNRYRVSDGFMVFNGTGQYKAYYTQNTLLRTTKERELTIQDIKNNFKLSTTRMPKSVNWLRTLFLIDTVKTAGIFCKVFDAIVDENYIFTDNAFTKAEFRRIPSTLKEKIYGLLNYTNESRDETVMACLRKFLREYYFPRREREEEQRYQRALEESQEFSIEVLIGKIDLMQKQLTEMKKILKLIKGKK